MAIVEAETIPEGLAFDDVLLRPGHSAVMPSATNIGTMLTRAIRLNLPILSAAMDTVTEARLAIAMAEAGGIGVIHRNLEPADQAEEVRKVKRFESGMVVDPITIFPDATLADALALMKRASISGIPVVERERRQARKTHRHPHQPRRALRRRSAPAGDRTHDPQGGDGARGRHARRGAAAAPPASDREAGGDRRFRPLRRPHHRQGHREGDRPSRTPPRTPMGGCGSPPPLRSATRGSSALSS